MTNKQKTINKMYITVFLFIALVFTMGAMDSYYFSADQITSGTLDSDRLNINVLEADSLIEGTNITLDTSEAGVVVITAASGGGGITKTDVQNMPVDTTDIFWDTSEVDTIRAEINTENFPEFLSFVEGNNMTIDTSEAGIIVLNSTASGDVSFSDFVETLGLNIDTSETGLAYFEIDYTVVPSFTSFVEGTNITLDTSEAGILIINAAGGSISETDVQNMMVEGVNITIDTTESGLIYISSAGGGVAYGNVITVAVSGGDYTSISAAISGESWSEGDVIRVMSGTYTETAVVNVPKGVAIVGIGNVIIDFTSQNADNNFHCAGGVTTNFLNSFYNLHIKCMQGGAITTDTTITGLVVRNCILEFKDTIYTAGYLIESNSGNVLIENCEFYMNTTETLTAAVGALVIYDAEYVIFKNNIIDFKTTRNQTLQLITSINTATTNKMVFENNTITGLINSTSTTKNSSVFYLVGSDNERLNISNNNVKMTNVSSSGTSTCYAIRSSVSTGIEVESFGNTYDVQNFTNSYAFRTKTDNNVTSIFDWITAAEGNDTTTGGTVDGVYYVNGAFDLPAGILYSDDLVEGDGILIDTSETGLAYFDIDYTVLPSLSSFVDSDSVTWNTSEVGVVIATASGGISLGDVQNMVVDSESVTWDTSETGVMIATATAPSFSTETYLNIMSSNASGICQNLKGLWGMTGTTTALEDLSYAINSGTLEGGLTFATDRTTKNMGYTTLFNGTTDYIDFGDHDDFSFGDGSTDSAFSICALINVDDDANTRMIVSKYDQTTGTEGLEYYLFLTNTEKIIIKLFSGNDAAKFMETTADAGLSVGYHLVIVTYDGSGLSSGLKVSIDGILVASTGSDVTYTAMENTTGNLFLGARESTTSGGELFFPSYISFVAIEKSEMTASEVFRLWKLVEGVYGL